MEFPIAILAVAAFLFVTGVVGRGTSLTAPIGLKVEGKVGGVPRVIFALTSALLLVVALVAFVIALDPQTQPTTQGGAETARPASATAAEPTRRAQAPSEPVEFTLLVGLRPQLNQLSEHMELLFDGKRIASWNSDRSNPSETLRLHAEPGRHRYEFQGDYSFQNQFGMEERHEADGEGTITIDDGTRLGVDYRGGTTFALGELR